MSWPTPSTGGRRRRSWRRLALPRSASPWLSSTPRVSLDHVGAAARVGCWPAAFAARVRIASSRCSASSFERPGSRSPRQIGRFEAREQAGNRSARRERSTSVAWPSSRGLKPAKWASTSVGNAARAIGGERRRAADCRSAGLVGGKQRGQQLAAGRQSCRAAAARRRRRGLGAGGSRRGALATASASSDFMSCSALPPVAAAICSASGVPARRRAQALDDRGSKAADSGLARARRALAALLRRLVGRCCLPICVARLATARGLLGVAELRGRRRAVDQRRRRRLRPAS